MPATEKSRRRRGRWALFLLLGALVSPIFLWVAIHRIPWLGPLLADGARAIVGPSAVATVEDVAYGGQDRWHRFWRAGEAPRPHWDAPAASVPALATASSDVSEHGQPAAPRFRPADVGPLGTAPSAQGDGTWVVVKEAACGGHPCLYKTLLHPDPLRGWAFVAVAAVDVESTRLHLVAGVEEPKATVPEAKNVSRPGLVPEQDRATLVAAFNGGFKTEHGALGMQLGDLVLVPPQRWGCTIARLEDNTLAIGSHPGMQGQLSGAWWWRQAPSCLVENGVFAPGVLAEGNINWGKAVSGDTIIRRSAIGIDEARRTLFVGIGDATSAGAMARAMRHAGAHTVAQLDVNHSFPKMLIFEEGVGRPLCPGFKFSEKDYVERPSARDFFYVTRRP